MKELEKMRKMIRENGDNLIWKMMKKIEELERCNEDLRENMRKNCLKCSKLKGCPVIERKQELIEQAEAEIKVLKSLVEFCNCIKKEEDEKESFFKM